MSYLTEDILYYKQCEKEFNQNYQVVSHPISRDRAIRMVDERISALKTGIADAWFKCTKETKTRKIEGLEKLKEYLGGNVYSLPDAVDNVVKKFPILSSGYFESETSSVLSKLKTGYYTTIERR